MSKTNCKDGCEFLKWEQDEEPRCIVYKKKLHADVDGSVTRLKKCVRHSREWKVANQISDIHTFYDSFVCEMDLMLDNLKKLIKGEK